MKLAQPFLLQIQLLLQLLQLGRRKGDKVEHLLPAPLVSTTSWSLTCPRTSCSSRCQALWSSANWGDSCPGASALGEREGFSWDVGPGVGGVQLRLIEVSGLKWGHLGIRAWDPALKAAQVLAVFTPSTHSLFKSLSYAPAVVGGCTLEAG